MFYSFLSIKTEIILSRKLISRPIAINKSPWFQGQVGIKLLLNLIIIYQKLANFKQKKNIYDNRLDSVIFSMKMMRRIDENIMQRVNFEFLEMQKRNIPTDRTQRADQKNCLFVIFTPRVMVIKVSKIDHFSLFLMMTAKIQFQFGRNIKVYLTNGNSKAYWSGINHNIF